MPPLWPLLLSLTASIQSVVALGPWAQYLTEPEMKASMMELMVQPNDSSRLDPGYFFVTPYVSDYRIGSFGPHIFNNQGHLIWNGNYTAKIRAMDAHVCDWEGEVGNHICYNDAKPVEQGGHSSGLVRFFNNHYEQVGPDFGADGDLRAPDIHELNTPGQEGETYIVDIYQIRRMDLSAYMGPQDGFVLDACFQEIVQKTKEVHFQWCALDWMPIWHTYMFLHDVNSPNYSAPIAGNGKHNRPWDWFHINAVAKNLEGDYAISGRHLNTIFKVAGKNNPHGYEPGTIIWHLGGKLNDFKMHDFNFSRQHTVRWHSTGKTESVLTLFDNAFDGVAHTARYSTGKLIKVNNETNDAWLLQQYEPVEKNPEKGRSFSQGSVQIMDNGNVIVGWGNKHFFSEYTHDGEMLLHASYTGQVESFRIWKFPWKGYPKTVPKVLSYALNCTGALYGYVSWNGATEVSKWRFYTSAGTKSGPWKQAGTFDKTNFETFANLTKGQLDSQNRTTLKNHGFAPYVYVEALDAEDKVLARSKTTETFVPLKEIQKEKQCNETMCAEKWFKFSIENSCGGDCQRSNYAGVWALVVGVLFIELVSYAVNELVWRVMGDAGPDFIPIANGGSGVGGSSRGRVRRTQSGIGERGNGSGGGGLRNLLSLVGLGGSSSGGTGRGARDPFGRGDPEK